VRNIINGNEAVAWAAMEMGLNYFSHYPGSPVNKIAPAIYELNSKYKGSVVFNDAINEHVATLSALGASLSGARSMVVMKHVGMNIAADPLNYIGYTGIRGGMLLVVGTDPGAQCSTGEEDPHWYLPQINLPLFEPTTISQIYYQTKEAFLLSEKYATAVVVFLPTRLCFNHDSLLTDESKIGQAQREFKFIKNPASYINVGAQCVANSKKLFAKMETISQDVFFGKEFFNANSAIGVITRGATFGHSYESILRLELSEKVHLLNIDMTYPLNEAKLLPFFANKKEVVVIEDQGGFLENSLKSLFYGKIQTAMEGKIFFTPYGEISFSSIYNFFADKFDIAIRQMGENLQAPHEIEVPERLGTFCEGCPHRASFYIIEKVLRAEQGDDRWVIGGDIGCSSLPPQRADWLLCMNAGVGISQGITAMASSQLVISTGGDASFFHAGISGIASAVHNKVDLLHLVFDNEYIAMTGHQASLSSNPKLDHEKLLYALGVDKLFTVDAFDLSSYEKKLKQLVHSRGVRVLWVKGACSKMLPAQAIKRREAFSPTINSSKCQDCTLCYRELQCPAIVKKTTNLPHFSIDLDRCKRCRVCKQVCPNGAISANVNWMKLAQALLAKDV